MESLTEEYLLKWNSHNSEIVSEFHNLCKDDRFTDCTIAAEEECFKAHKLVLSACSPYFRSLFEKTPCQHPVIFLKDVSAEHVAQLLKYMYLGQISVKREDLNTILETANGLRIRGLMTDSDETRDSTLTAQPNKTNSDSGSIKEGRKGYVPKKLRASSATATNDQDSIVSSPRALSDAGVAMDAESASISPEHHNGGGAGTPEGSEGTPDEEQPWNLSQNKETIGHARFPILGSYLKNPSGSSSSGSISSATKKSRTGSIDDFLETIRNKNKEEVNSTGSSSAMSSQQSLAQSWLEQLTAMQAEAAADNNDGNTVPLQETLGLSGIDIAERIRAMAGPLSQTYGGWLGGASSGRRGNSSPEPGPSGTQRNNNSTPPPVAGPSRINASSIKGELGEIGPNGKPSVTCEVCGKKLADPSSLYRHRKIHSGDKPHKCPYCARRFIQRYNMKQHMKTHRMERMENPELAALAAGEYARLAKGTLTN